MTDRWAIAGQPATDKLALTSTSLLALALGMGVGTGEAQASLIIKSFTTDQNDHLQAGDPVSFANGAYIAQLNIEDPDPDFKAFLSLTGSGDNKVAVTTAGCTMNCALQLMQPGSEVDGSLHFATSGSIKFGGVTGLGDGTYYFGLNAVPTPSPDPFGWVEVTRIGDEVELSRFAFQDQEGLAAPIPAAVPEPATLSLFALGASAVLAARRRRRRAA